VRRNFIRFLLGGVWPTYGRCSPSGADPTSVHRLLRPGTGFGGGGEHSRNGNQARVAGDRLDLASGHVASTPTAGQRILLVDDEPRIREVVATYLRRDGYDVETAVDGESARRGLAEFKPDLVVLDLMLPAVSGFEVLTEIRRDGDLPVILLTARAEESDRVAGLELGADDYVVKPFSPRELVARVRSVLRRAGPRAPSGPIEFDGILVDGARRVATVEGSPVELTAKEFDLLAYLVAHPQTVFSRGQLLESVWGSSAEWQDPATVTVHVRRIRQKIERDPQTPRWVQTVWGVGYRLGP
jgi:DNA-binding response OmpR family regulator